MCHANKTFSLETEHLGKPPSDMCMQKCRSTSGLRNRSSLYTENCSHIAPGVEKRALRWASLPSSPAREGGSRSAHHRCSWHLGQPSERLATAHTGCHVYEQEERAISVSKWKICGSRTAAVPSQHSLEPWENESTITGKQNKAASPDT